MKKVTVFTPAYNRAHTLPRLFESLLKQTDMNFDWYVINDGSSDNTDELIEGYRSSGAPFDIIYENIPNGGKMRAINRAVEKIKTEFIFIVDSDDYLLPDAIEKINRSLLSLPESYAGLSFVKGSMVDSSPVFTGGEIKFDGDYIDITNLERKKYGIDADMAEVYRVFVLKKYPFKVYEGEKFVPEATVWDRIALDGLKLRWYRDIIYICEYLEGGLSRSSWKLLDENPMGFAMLYSIRIETAETEKEKMSAALQMSTDAVLGKHPGYIFKSSSPLRGLICLPAALLLSVRRRRQIKAMREC